MTAQELYECLKKAADYFGVGFRGMSQINAFIRDGRLVLSFHDDEIVTDINHRIENERE